VRVLFVLTVILIVHGSLYPWRLEFRELSASPFWILLHSWPEYVDRYFLRDVALNIAIYIPVGLTAHLAIAEQRSRWLRTASAILFGAALSATIEMLQLYAETRMCNAFDVVANTGGAVVGALVANVVPRASEKRWGTKLVGQSDRVFLLSIWLAGQLYPVYPQFSRAPIAAKLATLVHSAPSAASIFSSFAVWLTLAALAKPKSAAALLIFIPLKIALHNRTMNWGEIIGAIAALALARFLTIRMTATVVVAAVIAQELAPFQWSSGAKAFLWIPFVGALEADQFASLLVLIQKSFIYAAAVWLIWRSGVRLAIATSVMAGLLLVLELAQTHVPSRVPETSDATLAILGGAVFHALDRHRNSTSAPSVLYGRGGT